MKIKYIHSSEPNKEKIMDSKVQKRADAIFGQVFFKKDDARNQEEYDAYLLKKLEKEKSEGKILRYEIIEEE